MQTLLTVVLFQSITVFLLYTINQKSNIRNIYLFQLVGAIGLHALFKITLLYVSNDELYFNKNHGSFALLYGPLLYLYASQPPQDKPQFGRLLIHIIPFILGLICNFSLLLQTTFKQYPIAYLDQISSFIAISSLVSITLYSILSLIRVFQLKATDILPFRKVIVKIYSLGFLSFIIFLVFLHWVFEPKQLGELPRILFYSMLLFFLFMTIYYLQKANLSINPSAEHSIEKQQKEKYKNHKLEAYDLPWISQKIMQVLDKHEPYLDPDFNLDHLANLMNLPKLYITQALNMHLKVNFYQLINEKRIQKAIDLIQKDKYADQMQIVSAKSGFKSKTTFYKYFKDYTGCTPSEYRKAIYKYST